MKPSLLPKVASLLGVMVCLSGRANAQEQPLTHGAEVVVAGCTGLDTREIARLVGLEVGVIAPDPRSLPRFTLYLSCSADGLIINVEDPVTGKSLQRQIAPPGRGTPGAERMIALIASQLLRVSWMELLMANAPPAEAVASSVSSEVIAAAKVAAQNALAPEVTRSVARNEVELVIGAQWRDLARAFTLAQVALRAAHQLSPRWKLCLQVSGEAGRADRQSGAVNAWGAFADVGGGWTSPRLGPLSLALTVLIGVGYFRLAGAPGNSEVVAGAVDAVAFDGRIGLGPTLHLGAFQLSCEVAASYSTPRAIGEVAGERSVVAGGFGVGAGVRAGWTFGGD